jgi:type II secretory pathway pseudopilin PulG
MGQRGYNMVMLMVAITVLNIMVALALPMWSQEIQRDREEELISRGWQYVEAIRVFQNRFQRMPVRLEELMEVKPRSIRKLWKDPMTDGKMQPIFQNEGQPLIAQPGLQPQPGQPDPNNPQGQKPNDPNDPNAPPPEDPTLQPDANGDKPQVAGGPIVGVRSRSNKKSILVFYGKERYDQWRFTLDLMLQVRPAPGQNPAPGAPAAGLNLSTRWLGRPSPFLQPPGSIPPTPGDPLPGGGNPPDGSGRRPPASGRMPRGGAKL